MVAEAQYGGKITDTLDRRLFKTFVNVWLNPGTCADGFAFNPKAAIQKIQDNFVYRVQSFDQIGLYQTYIKGFPEVDSPEMFGLHPNADLTFRVKEVTALFGTLSDTQPKGGGSSGDGPSREDVVGEKADEMLSKMPEQYNEDDYKAKIQKLGGLSVPLNIFLYQEIQRLQAVLFKVINMLNQTKLAINGEVVMTEDLQSLINSVFEAKVPKMWLFTVAGDELSWLITSLGNWNTSLIARDDQMRSWLTGGRPSVYWLTGFFNPQGMLTAMKQEVCRKHLKDQASRKQDSRDPRDSWALDDIMYHTEVQHTASVDHIKSAPAEGCYIHGLSLEGCAWSRDAQVLLESEPKTLFVALPILLVTANNKVMEMEGRKGIFGAQGPYDCPCYKYRTRTDRFYIFSVTLKCTVEKNGAFWALRGAALLCNID